MLAKGNQFLPINIPIFNPDKGTIVPMIVWYLDLQLLMQSVLITTDVVGLTPAQVEVHTII